MHQDLKKFINWLSFKISPKKKKMKFPKELVKPTVTPDDLLLEDGKPFRFKRTVNEDKIERRKK